MTHYDLIVIGGGPGGYEIAAEQAAKGLRVALFEKDRLGGTCLNRGCIPTKCLCASASMLSAVSRAAQFGVMIDGEPRMDLSIAAERMEGVMTQLREGVETLLRSVDLIRAEAALIPAAACPSLPEGAAKAAVEADGQVYSATRILIATGSRPASLPVPGAELCIDSDQALTLRSVPQSMVIIGGGVIGMEFASIFSAMGCTVTVIEYCPEILPPFDTDVAKRLRMTMSRRGVKILVGEAVQSIEPSATGVIVTHQGKKGTDTVEAETALMAVGRRPVLPPGCAEAGIKLTHRGFIEVDERMRTSVDGVYAAGDVTGLRMLAHFAAAQARVAMGQDVMLDIIPSAVFTTPEVAMVGATERELKAEGRPYQVGKAMMAGIGKAMAMGETEGFAKVLVDTETQLLTGFHVIGAHASDLVAEVAALMAAGMKADQIAYSLVHNHPTLSEIIPAAIAARK